MDEEDNKKLWQNYTKNVKPLVKKKILKDLEKPLVKIGRNKNSQNISKPSRMDLPQKNQFTAGLSIDISDGVDKSTVKKLKSGNYPIDVHLDLHGLSKDAALNKLQNLLKSSIDNHYRCLLVITGKGSRNSEGKPILRDSVLDFLSQPNMRKFIIMFCFAHIKHGGSGALYILLKRLCDN